MILAAAALALTLRQDGLNDFTPTGPKITFAIARRGSFEITTAPKLSPKTVAQIVSLVKAGFYNAQRVHRVEYWVTQWGDSASRTKPMNDPKMGDGDSGHPLPFEMCDVDFKRGVVGIASEGLQLGGDCQLFVIKQDRLYLWHSYAVVGKVTKGMDVVDRIRTGDRILSATVDWSRR